MTQEEFNRTGEFLLRDVKEKLIVAGKGSARQFSKVPTGCLVILPDESQTFINQHFGDYEGKKVMQAMVYDHAKKFNATAVFYQMVATSLNDVHVREEIGLEPPPLDRPDKIKYYEQKLYDWVEKKTGGKRSFHFLPDKYVKDVILVIGTGPRLENFYKMEYLTWDEEKPVFTVPEDFGTLVGAYMGMISPWWD